MISSTSFRGVLTSQYIFLPIVGYDFDEYSPRKQHQLEEISPGVYLMDSRVPVSEANEVLGLSDREVHTVGGLVRASLRRIPVQGDNIEEAGFRITFMRQVIVRWFVCVSSQWLLRCQVSILVTQKGGALA